MSLTLNGLCKHRVSIHRAGPLDAFGKGECIAVCENTKCRYVDYKHNTITAAQEEQLLAATAAVWISGKVAVMLGDVVTLGSGVSYTVIGVKFTVDLIRTNKIDHTKILLK